MTLENSGAAPVVHERGGLSSRACDALLHERFANSCACMASSSTKGGVAAYTRTWSPRASERCVASRAVEETGAGSGATRSAAAAVRDGDSLVLVELPA